MALESLAWARQAVTSGQTVLLAFLVAAALAIIVMIGIGVSTRRSAADNRPDHAGNVAKFRLVWFGFLMVGGLVAFFISIRLLPYPNAAELKDSKHFTIVAHQYQFDVPAAVPIRTQLVFDVTSVDVNHGFGIYDPHGALLEQVQAMQDYVNHLPVEFTTAGRYTIRCMEYCGISHSAMQAGFEVR
jgi:cytochrome c oxidase subunit II